MPNVWIHARLATLADADSEGNTLPAWGWIEDGALVSEQGRLVWVGPSERLPHALRAPAEDTQDLHGAVVTPGLIDCHTHLIYAGQRAHEFELRLQGADYAGIARAGGGILSTVAATRAASEDALFGAAAARARALMAEGVTTLEVKSGYGLDEAAETRSLRTARRLATLGLEVRTTYLAAHALPPEFAGRADDYIDALCAWMPGLAHAGLIDAVDAFCESIGFSRAQIRRVFDAARRLGLPVKLHAEQLSDQAGTELACAFDALSCDHLEYLSAEGVAALARSGTVAVLLPGAYYFLREQHPPPVEALRAAGIPIAVASDHNPGTSPTLSLLLMLNMACTLFRLSPEEALRGVTQHAARALGLKDRGRLAAGQCADFCIWDLEHPRELAYFFGRNPLQSVVRGGLPRMNPAQPVQGIHPAPPAPPPEAA